MKPGRKTLSATKVRCEVWLLPVDARRAEKLARAQRKTRAGWMRDVIMTAIERDPVGELMKQRVPAKTREANR